MKRKEMESNDITELLEEGRFEDIHRKYGKKKYKRYIDKMKETDVFYETGSRRKALVQKVKNIVLKRIVPYSVTATLSIPVGVTAISETGKKVNSMRYSKEIEEYNDKIEEYAEEINSMNLTDIQIFMKVIYDMWQDVKGYGFPKEEIYGYYRLTLEKDEIGVCRHFADDVTAKLNAINPEYNARNLIVCMKNNKYTFAKIKRNIISRDGNAIENNSSSGINSIIDSYANNIGGNHMITAVDIPDKKITLVLDPTNPEVGVFKDGKIYMFSTPDGKGIESRKVGQLVIEGIKGVIDVELSEIKSFLPCEYSLEEVEKMYGTEAQNEALEYIEKLEEAEKNDFIEKVKVDEKKAIKKIQENVIRNKIYREEK